MHHTTYKTLRGIQALQNHVKPYFAFLRLSESIQLSNFSLVYNKIESRYFINTVLVSYNRVTSIKKRVLDYHESLSGIDSHNVNNPRTDDYQESA